MLENIQYKCLKCGSILEVQSHMNKTITCDCGELKLKVKGNNHKIDGKFGDYYCINPQKRIIVGDKVKVITLRNVIDDCYAEIYHWEKLDTME